MEFTNSPLVVYTKLSPNCSKRTGPITKITIHHMAGNLSVESCGNVFQPTSRQASSNYGIGTDGRVGMYVEEKDRAWTSSNRENDNMAVTLEVANDSKGPDWHVSDKALAATIELCADICKRNGIERLNYTGDKSGNLTMHKWFASTACPGPYLGSKFPYIAEEVNKILAGEKETKPEPKPENNTNEAVESQQKIDVAKFKTNTPQQTVDMIGDIFRADMKRTGVLASISMAQFILESGWGKGELAQNALNFFSMKATVSGNSWEGSTWKGEKYNLLTSEWDGEKYVEGYAYFRKYDSIENSIADHSAYLCNAMKGSQKRYNGLIGEKSYKRAAEIIKAGGYATDPKYVSKLCSLVERYNLDKYDTVDVVEENPAQPSVEPQKPAEQPKPVEPNTTPNQNKIKTGDLVRVVATYYYNMSKEIPSWVKKHNWYVKSVSGEKVIIDKNEKGTNSINSPVHINGLQLVESVKEFKVGDVVRIKKDAEAIGHNRPFQSWVYRTDLYVREIRGDTVVVSIYSQGAITGVVSKDDIIRQ